MSGEDGIWGFYEAQAGRASPDSDETRALIARYETDEGFDPYNYVPPGPKARQFLQSTALTSFIMGPVGAGKTVASAFKRIMGPALYMPACNDGVIRDRTIVIRDTFRRAEKTVLASWLQWFPRTFPGSSWSGGNDRPATHVLRFRNHRGQVVELITEFIGLNGQDIGDALRGYEFSGAWLNEADTLNDEALPYVEQRTGRYPKTDTLPKGSRRHRQVIGDLNAPDIDNWVYAKFVEKRSPNRLLFEQPSGLSADAENIENLEPGYYEQMAADNEDWYVQRFVHNRFGYSRAGKPVYDTFNAAVHVAPRPLAINSALPLLIGLDGGGGTLNPAAVFAQDVAAQLNVLRELVPGHGYGPSRFGELLAATIDQHFGAAREIRAWADPASQYGGDKEGGQLAWVEIVAAAIGVPILIPFDGSNEIALRTDAVKAELKTDGQRPNMLIDRAGCPKLIRGFASGYRYKRKPDSASTEYDAVPEKNDYSHPHDGLQYLVGGYRGRTRIIRNARADAMREKATAIRSVWGGSRAPGSFDPMKVG
jgi:hypothetical protein